MDIFIFYFLNLKDIKLTMVLELLAWKRYLCLGNMGWKSQVTKILFLTISKFNGFFVVMGENIVKRAKGTKVKVIFQGLHMTHVIFVLVYNFKFIFMFWVPPPTLHFRYKYIFIKNWFYIIYIMHSCPLSHKHEQSLLLKTHFQNP